MSVIPGHDHLIDRFVSRELQPLFSQHQTLAAKSIQRKVGALRAGVEATLRSRVTRIEAALRARIGDQVAEALRSHGALLQIWANRVLTQFCQQFDARAQVYNNQLVQSADGTAAPEVRDRQ